MKRDGNKFLMIFILIILIGFVSADGCSIVQRDSCDDYIVMGLSDDTNAHGELADQGNYGWVLCCDFGDGVTSCSDTNKIISLSSETNAHAEIPYPSQGSNYDIPVCYDGLKCVNIIESCEDTINPDTGKIEYPMEILSLSSWTNAHIGRFADYPTKVCCNKIECRTGEVGSCSDYYEEECNYDPCGVADDSVAENTEGEINCEEGYICNCEFIEGGEFIKGECVPTWEEIDQPTCGDGEVDPGEDCDGDNFGDITGCNSLGYEGGDLECTQECKYDLSQCTGGNEEGECGDGEINNFPYETCDGEELNDKTCSDFGLSGDGLACYSAGSSNNCTFDTSGCEIGEGGNPSKIGKCSYDENTDDDCEDKFLTYSWTATWTWADENTGKSPPCEEDYISDGSLCYYDPNGAKAKCVDGSNTVPCPAQIQLPFFGKYSVVMIIGLIIFIYVFMKWKENKKNSKKKRKKK